MAAGQAGGGGVKREVFGVRRFKKGRHPWDLSEWLRRRHLRAVRLVVERDKAVLIVVQNGKRKKKAPGRQVQLPGLGDDCGAGPLPDPPPLGEEE